MDEFRPPFCANPHCIHHSEDPSEPYVQYVSWGSYETAAFGKVPRFRCTSCGKTFSVQTFRVDYWLKRVYDYRDLTERLCSCSSIRAIGRAYHVAGKSIQNRIGRGARQVLDLESRLSSTREPDEDLAADGFESFCVSQYYPNNIHLLVGKRSQFVYESDHVTLRRKGRMTDAQKKLRERLDLLFRPDPRGIEKSFGRIGVSLLSVLSDEGRPSLTLWTDEKRNTPGPSLPPPAPLPSSQTAASSTRPSRPGPRGLRLIPSSRSTTSTGSSGRTSTSMSARPPASGGT